MGSGLTVHQEIPTLVQRLLDGDIRSVTRLITLVEADSPQVADIYSYICPPQQHAHVVGICGPPGTGKSTLIDALIPLLRKEDLRVGVLAIDPTSPFSGGALLGDRIRMQRHATDPKVFIRSMATRGHLGGLARATQGAIRILHAFGMDAIVVETVGIGQVELDITQTVDTTVLVTMPGLGDQVQVLKAGIMEAGDVFAVNKADVGDAEKVVLEIECMLALGREPGKSHGWTPPVMPTVAARSEGIGRLWLSIRNHHSFLRDSGALQVKRQRSLARETLQILERRIHDWVVAKTMDGRTMDELADSVSRTTANPHVAASTILKQLGICTFEHMPSEHGGSHAT